MARVTRCVRWLLALALTLTLLATAQPTLAATYLQITDIDQTPYSGMTILALDQQGHPHIAYLDGDSLPASAVVRSATYDGSTWSTKEVARTTALGVLAFALDSAGRGNFIYPSSDPGNDTLEYTTLANGSLTSVSTDVSSGAASMVIDLAGVAHVSLFDPETSSIVYAKIDPSDRSNWDISLVSANGIGGTLSAIALDAAGVPHVSYFSQSTRGDLEYASPGNPNWTTQQIGPQGAGGVYSSLVFDANGQPHIAYADDANILWYASLVDGVWQREQVAALGSFSVGISLAFAPNGQPRISYDDPGQGLMLASLVAGSWQSRLVDPDGGGHSSLVIDAEGGSHIAYYAYGAQSIRYASTALDSAPPVISGSPTSEPNANGWYNHDVTINWTCGDTGGSGLASCPDPTTISTEGTNLTVQGTATDHAGNWTTVDSAPPVNIDKTPPVLSFSGNQGTYTVDQTVTISCTATDALSRIDTVNCPEIDEPAARFGIGPQTLEANAVDRAGNTAEASISFSVVVTLTSLCRLTEQYTASARDAGRLCAPLSLAARAERMHNDRMKTAAVNTYILLLRAQPVRGLSPQEAATLISFARSL